MKRLIHLFLVCCLLIAGAAATVTAQNLISVNLNSPTYETFYVIAYDPVCKIRVFEGVLGENGSDTVRVCADDRGLGSIVIYDRNGRGLRFPDLRDGSGVDIRFR